MNSVEIAAKLVRKRFDNLYNILLSSINNDTLLKKSESQSETEFLWMLLQDIKQEFMTIVQCMPIDSEIHSINNKEVNKCIAGFEIALREEYDKAREMYKDVIKSNIELQHLFIDISSVSIPDCKVLKSEYMIKNYPNIVRYEEVIKKYNGSPSYGSLSKNDNGMVKSTDVLTEIKLSEDELVESNKECTDDGINLSDESVEDNNREDSNYNPFKSKFSEKMKQAKLKKEEDKKERTQRIEKAKKSFKNLLANIQIVAICERLVELMQSIQNAIEAAQKAVAEQEIASRDLFNNSDSGSILEIADTLKQLKYEIFVDADGQNRFRLRRCGSGEIVLVSKCFKSIPECIEGIERLSGFIFENKT